MAKIGILPDVHVPYHSKRALALALDTMKKEKVDTVVILGDFADFYSVSFHRKDPARKVSLAQELGACRVAIKEVEAIGARRLVFIEGNHEDRLSRYIIDKAPALHGVLDLRTALGLEKWQIVPYTSHIMLDGVVFAHDLGSTMGGATAIPTALRTAARSVVIGHIHRQEIHIKSDISGKPIVGYSPGWLGNPKSVDYRHRALVARDWRWGFGILDAGTLRPFTITPGYKVLEGIPAR